MHFKIAIFTNLLDKFLIFLLFVFFYSPFLFLGFYLNKKSIINKFFILPFSFLLSNVFYGFLIIVFNFFRLKINEGALFLIILIFFIYIINFFLIKKTLKLNKVVVNILNDKNFYIFFVFLLILFISFFSIPAFPDGDAALHISKISKFVNDKFSFYSPFDTNLVDIVFPFTSSYLVSSLTSFILKLSPLSVWSFSLVFYIVIDYLTLTGFFYWLFSKKLISIILSFLYIIISRFQVSFLTYTYPNNHNIIAFYFMVFSFFSYFLEKNNKKIFYYLFLISIISYQMIHIAMSSVLFFIILSLYLAIFIFLYIKKFFYLRLKFKIRLKEILTMVLGLFFSFVPLFIYVFYLIFLYKLDYNTKIIKITENTDPFIINLYKIYTEFNLKNKIFFYFKDINFDLNFPFFGNYFLQFFLYFLLFILSYKNKNFKLLFFSLFVFFINLLIFNFGFISQKILPLWLLMRIEQTSFVIFIISFLLIYLLFIKILDNKKGYYLYLIFLLFLIFSSVFRLQKTRIYAREINTYYQNCELYWSQISRKINFYGKIYTFGGCEYPQYLLNVYTINSRYSPYLKQKNELDNLFSILINDKSFKKEDFNQIKFFLKKNINFIVFKNCNYLEKIKKLNFKLNLGDIKKIDDSCIIKI